MTSAIPPRPSRKDEPRKPVPKPVTETPPAPEAVYVYARRPFNSAGVIALVFSLLWLLGIGSLIGLIGGISAVRQCQRENMSGEWAGHVAWILGLFGLLSTVAAVLAAIP